MKNTKKLAIDVVLLPPEEIMDKAIEVNKQLINYPNNKIILNKENCLPHITLCMGVIDEENLPNIKELLEDVAKELSSLSLKIVKIDTEEEYTGFAIEKTQALQSLHETIMEKLLPYATHDATVEMVYSPPEVEEKTLFWINNYRKKFSFENYYPHITLGTSEVIKKIDASLIFTASTLALCHLGNYCTCRKVLIESI